MASFASWTYEAAPELRSTQTSAWGLDLATRAIIDFCTCEKIMLAASLEEIAANGFIII